MRNKYTSLFLLIIFIVVSVSGCQTFAPDHDNGKTLPSNTNSARNKIGFFESAKRLFLPDFDSPVVSSDLEIADNNAERSKQPIPKPAPNYAYGNSLSVYPPVYPQQNNFYPNQTQLPPSYLHAANINTNIAPPPNHLAIKNAPTISDAPQAQIAAAQPKVADAVNLPDKNVDDGVAKVAPDSVASNVSTEKVEKVESDTKLNKSTPIKKYAVDPLLPQKNDSENFRLFLKELAEVP
ncbi:MAG: hypothetical protein LBK06_11005, partial [Planctomycetaceae bacterium]|nr:hypothetical protein [Planctomycetaceae bacterium]